MKKLLILPIVALLIIFTGCPPTGDENVEPEETTDYTIEGNVELSNYCSEHPVGTKTVVVNASLLGGGGNPVTQTQTITLTQSDDDSQLARGNYSITIRWPQSRGNPSKWGAILIKNTDQGDACDYGFNCDDEKNCSNSYPDYYESEIGSNNSTVKNMSIICTCAK